MCGKICQKGAGSRSKVLTFLTINIWASSPDNLSSEASDNTGADKPAHPRSLFRAFVIRILKSITRNFVTGEISIF